MPTKKMTKEPAAKVARPVRRTKKSGGDLPGTPGPAAAGDPSPGARRPGFRLVQRINFEMAKRGITQYSQVSAEMGFTDDPRALYLTRMQTGNRYWNNASLDRLRMVAAWLDVAPIEVMMMADVITPDDALSETLVPAELDRRVGRITLDPEYGAMLPHYADMSVLPPWAKVLLLVFYDDLNRFRLERAGRSSGIPEVGLLRLARRLPK
jgi:hypothetical protein